MKKPQSVWGILSVIQWMLATFLCLLLVFGGHAFSIWKDLGISMTRYMELTVTILIFGAPFLYLVGLLLALAGMFQKDRNRFFPIAGLIANTIVAGGFLLLLLLLHA